VAEDSGSFLVRTGLIRRDDLARLRRGAAQRGTTLFEELVLHDRDADDALSDALHAELGLRRIAANDLAALAPELIELVPEKLCVAYRLIPTSRRGEHLEVVISNPGDEQALAAVAAATGYEVVPVLATQLQIAWCLARYLGVVTPLGETLLERPAEAEDTARSQARSRPRHARPPTARDDEVELKPRAGEIAVRSEADATPASSRQDLPAVVLDDSFELREALLGREAVPEAQDDAESGSIIYLTPDKRRNRTQTQLGLPPPAKASARLADLRAAIEDEIATEPGRYPPRDDDDDDEPAPELDDDPSVEGSDPFARDDTLEDRGDEVCADTAPHEAATPEPSAPDHDETVPSASSEGRVDEPAGREFDLAPAPDTAPVLPDEDEDFGPPGTTIPPPYLGAIPQSYEDLESGAIPIQADDPTLDESAPYPVGATDPYAHLDLASADLVRTLRALDANTARDAVIETLVAHAGRRFSRAAFFVIKAGALHPWATRGPVPSADLEAVVAEIPALAAVSASGRPFRGPITDEASRDFLEAWLGEVPEEVLAVPVSVRGRVVGILYGDGPKGRVYDEHVSVLARAAGDAFERVLQAKKRP
jgi:hypothetical protein